MTARTVRVGLEPVAAVVQRLAVLLAAGVAPASAWHYLADTDGPQSRRLRRVVRAIGTGSTVAEAIVGTLHTDPQRGACGPRATHRAQCRRVGRGRVARARCRLVRGDRCRGAAGGVVARLRLRTT